MRIRSKLTLLIALIAAASVSAQTTPADASVDTEQAARQADYQSMLEDAERARAEAEAARREAAQAAERARDTARRHAERAEKHSGEARQAAEAERRHAIEREEMERVQEELSRAHRELREATREIARAHREVARSAAAPQLMRGINLGERAVIGVVLGDETPEGVKVVGVSPGGPAEQAGLQAGDVLVSIRGEELATTDPEGRHIGRETVYRVIGEAGPGEALAMVVNRDGETWAFDVTPERREPASWQSLIRIPAAPPAPGVPPVIVEHIERIEIPDIDTDAFNEQVQELTEQLKTQKFRFVLPDGEAFEADGEFVFPESFDVEIMEFSDLAEQAMREANIWFGLPRLQGLELAPINEGLAPYFKTERGVLVLNARADNAYRLETGDVLLDINARAVNSPADVMRALRELEPGSQVEIAIKRNRKDKTLTVTMPENRLGQASAARIDP